VDLLRHLRYFVAVAEELHFGRAAARLHMAQPPLSQRIRGLEQELGVQLLDRSTRRVELTPAGRLLLDEARDLLARAERLGATMDRVRAGDLGELRAGAPLVIGGAVLARLLAAFRDRCPDVRLELRESSTAEQVRALTEGALDVGLITHPAQLGSLATSRALAKPLGVLVAAAGAPDGAVELGGLAARELVLSPRETAPDQYDDLLATCRAYGFVPRAVHHAGGAQFAAGLVLAGDAVAFATRDEPLPAGVVWRPLAGEPLHWRLSAAWRAGAVNQAIAAFADAAMTVLVADGGWVATDAPAAVTRRLPRPASGLLS
jgi:DNA-binding transcriptional LysR family regulator